MYVSTRHSRVPAPPASLLEGNVSTQNFGSAPPQPLLIPVASPPSLLHSQEGAPSERRAPELTGDASICGRLLYQIS